MTGWTVGDTTPALTGTILDGATGVSLTPALTVTAHVTRADTTTFDRAVTLGNQGTSPGSWSLAWTVGDLTVAGGYSVEIDVAWVGSSQVYGPVNFQVTAAAVGGGGTTFADVLEEVLSNLQGYTAASDQVTSVTADISLTDTTITVDDATTLGRGIIEVGQELMWVQTKSDTGNTATLLPKGRGWKGTIVTTHAAGDTVVVSPSVPRSAVAREVNNHIRALFPDVYAVATTEFVYGSVIQTGWAVPAEAVAILDVRWKNYLNNWQRVKGWEAENSTNLTDFPTGRCVRLWGIPVGRTVQVVYAITPVPLVAETDLFSTTGLTESAKDLVVLGTMARVIPNLDVSRLQVQYASAEEMGSPRPHGGAITVAKFFEQKYQLRLRQERAALNIKFPCRIHWTR